MNREASTSAVQQPPPRMPPPIDLAAVKAKQQATWSSGDYSVVGTTLQITGEALCEAVDLRSGERVLDVACGNGNAALAAARRFARVTGVDYVPALLARAGSRAAADGLPIELREGDAEALPFPDGAFDVVLSTFGVMFAPDQERAARELVRVCRHGGRIGLASWTPDGFVGQVFRVLGGHVPPPPGLRGPSQWGTEERLGGALRRGGARGPHRSGGSSRSATAPRRTGWRCSAPGTARSTAPSRSLAPERRARWRPTWRR